MRLGLTVTTLRELASMRPTPEGVGNDEDRLPEPQGRRAASMRPTPEGVGNLREELDGLKGWLLLQ